MKLKRTFRDFIVCICSFAVFFSSFNSYIFSFSRACLMKCWVVLESMAFNVKYTKTTNSDVESLQNIIRRDSLTFFGVYLTTFFSFPFWRHCLRENWDRKRVDTLKITTILNFCWDFFSFFVYLSIVSEKFQRHPTHPHLCPTNSLQILFLDASVAIHLRLNIPTLF